jgi:hypothetical protein
LDFQQTHGHWKQQSTRWAVPQQGVPDGFWQ